MSTKGYGDAYIVNWAGLPKFAAQDTSSVRFFPAQWQSPLLSWVNYYVPWDRATLYQWIRFYDTFHPLVGSCIDLHTQLPLSRFGLKGISDEKILSFYEMTIEKMDGYTLMFDQMREYWLMGEVFVYLVWDDNLNTYVDGEILPPEYIEIRGHPLVTGDIESSFEFYLIPDDNLVKFVQSSDDTAQNLKQYLPPEVLEAIETNKLIRINPFNLMVMMRKQARYNPRGTSIVLRCLKDLLFEDKIREAQYVIADRHVLPMEIWRVGNEKYPPSQKRISKIAQMVRDMQDLPKKNIVTHWAVSYEVVGAYGKFPNLSSEFDWVERRILTALFTNKAMTTGEGPNFATSSVAMRALLSRYIQVRSALENAWYENVFLPIALANKFYKTTQAELSHGIRRPYKEREPIIPIFDWRYKSNLLDDASFREIIVRLYEKKEIPFKIVADALGLDYDYVASWKKKEEGSIFDEFYKEYRRQLMKQGIPETEVPGYPVLESVRERKKLFDDKVREHAETKSEPKEEKQLTSEKDIIDESEKVFLSRGGIKRKVRIAKELYEKRNRTDGIGGKVNIGYLPKDNISWGSDFPKDLEKLGKGKRSVIVVRD